jgi:hypothetical protein
MTENVDRGSSFSVPIDLIGGGYRWPGAPKLNPKLTAMILRAEIGGALAPMTAITSTGDVVEAVAALVAESDDNGADQP